MSLRYCYTIAGFAYHKIRTVKRVVVPFVGLDGIVDILLFSMIVLCTALELSSHRYI